MILSNYQLSELTKRFKSDPYLTGVEKELMGKHLGISPGSLQNWFARKRRVEKEANELSKDQ